MPRTKTVSAKKKNKPAKPVNEIDTEADETEAAPIENIKKIKEVDITEDVIGVVEEKAEVDPLMGDEESEDSIGEDSGLDEEEIDPFGDKWEV